MKPIAAWAVPDRGGGYETFTSRHTRAKTLSTLLFVRPRYRLNRSVYREQRGSGNLTDRKDSYLRRSFTLVERQKGCPPISSQFPGAELCLRKSNKKSKPSSDSWSRS